MKLYAWKTGASLAIAIAAGYIILTALFAFWPMAADTFGQALMTGRNFNAHAMPGEAATTHWSFGEFIYAIALILVWGFTTGALFAWVHSYLHRSDA